MKNFSLVMLGAALGFSAMALTGGGASAAALQPFQPLAATQSNDGMIQLAASKKERMRDRWERHRDGRRCSTRFGNCRHFHNGYYYETPWWTLPLIVGGAIAADRAYDDDYNGGGYGSRHVEWCLDHYRSYNPRTNTWVSYSGNVNQCNSPYG